MEKVALLIGVSEYEPGLAPLPGAVKDIGAMQRVLQQAEIGGFTQVESLPNPDPVTMQVAIESLFSGRSRDDLVLLFFSGHGIKDEDGRLYFATRATRKAVNGELRKATAVPASFIHDMMSKCRSKRQVVILDCCFSGAFTEGLSAKDDGSIDVKAQLGGEGRVVLTSSSAIQYSFEQQGYDLSIYTHYLVEGMETGAADRDNDGFVSIDELHTYASGKVQEAVPAMQPGRHVVKQEGEKILLTKALIGDLKLRYRKEVEKFASRGEISPIGRSALAKLQIKLNILPEEAIVIEDEILKPYREYQNNLQQYRQMLANALQQEGTLSKHTRAELKELQNILGLRDEDIQPVVKQVTELKEASPQKEVELESIALGSQPQPLFVSPSNAQLSPQFDTAGAVKPTQMNPLLTKSPTQRFRKSVILVVAMLSSASAVVGMFFVISKKQTLIDQVCQIGMIISTPKQQDVDASQASLAKVNNSFEALKVVPFLNDKFNACHNQANSAIAAAQNFVKANGLAWKGFVHFGLNPPPLTEEQKLDVREKLQEAIKLLNETKAKIPPGAKLLAGVDQSLNDDKSILEKLDKEIEKQRKNSDIQQTAMNNLAKVKQFFDSYYAETNWYTQDRATEIQGIQKQSVEGLQQQLDGIRSQAGGIEPLANKYKHAMERVRLAFWIEENNFLELAESLTGSNFSDGSAQETSKKLDQGLQTFQLSSKSQKTLAEGQMNAAILSLREALAKYKNAIGLAELCNRSNQCFEVGEARYVPFKDVQPYNITAVHQKIRFSGKAVEAVSLSDVFQDLSKQMKLSIENARAGIKKSFSDG